MVKLNLSYGSVVKVKETGSAIDGMLVKVVGVSIRGVIDFYIVQFLDGLTRVIDGEEFSAFVVPEACLEVI